MPNSPFSRIGVSQDGVSSNSCRVPNQAGDAELHFARHGRAHRILAEFPELNRDLVLIDPESAAQVPASAAQAITGRTRSCCLRLSKGPRMRNWQSRSSWPYPQSRGAGDQSLGGWRPCCRNWRTGIGMRQCGAGRSATGSSSICASIPRSCGRGFARSPNRGCRSRTYLLDP
jgi:hypothetical protein